jgi:hypothetical protein
MEIADWYGLPVRLVLVAAHRLSERAIRRGLLCLRHLVRDQTHCCDGWPWPTKGVVLERGFMSASLEKLHLGNSLDSA